MKDLNKNEVYDLRGITEEQAEEIQTHLIDIGVYWAKGYEALENIKTRKYLIFKHGYWLHGSEDEPTTHISTLFEEKSLEEQLQEAEIKVEELKKQIEERDKPKIGDVVRVWDSSERYCIGVYEYTSESSHYAIKGMSYKWANIKKLTQQEVIELLFGK